MFLRRAGAQEPWKLSRESGEDVFRGTSGVRWSGGRSLACPSGDADVVTTKSSVPKRIGAPDAGGMADEPIGVIMGSRECPFVIGVGVGGRDGVAVSPCSENAPGYGEV